MVRRFVWAAWTAVAALVVLTAPALAAGPAVTSAVSISGDHMGYARVHLDHAIRVESDNGDPQYTVAFQGPGVFQAIILRSESGSSDGFRYSLMVQHDSLGGGSGKGSESTLNEAHALPSGDYRVYLIFDKGPAQARLRFSDGSEVAVSPDTPVNAKAEQLPKRANSTSNVEVVGDSGTLDSFGHFFFEWQVSFDLAFGSFEECIYPEGDAQAGPDAYGRGCPGGKGGGVEDGLMPGAVGRGDLSGDGDPTSFGYGANVMYTGLAPKLDILGVWISYADPPGTSSRPTPWLAVARDVVTVRSGKALIQLSCRARVRCRGRVRISPGGKVRRVQVPARATRTFRLTLPRRLARAVARHGSARATVRLSGTVSGQRRSDSRRVKLRRR